MPDLRTVLTETLREHLTCDCGEWAEDIGETCQHLADVLLGLPGVAVTQLTEPDESRDAFKREVAPMLLKWRYVLDQSAGDWAIAATIFDELTKSGFTINLAAALSVEGNTNA